MSNELTLWMRIEEPKTKFRGARHQLARSDEHWVVRFAMSVFKSLQRDDPLWPGSVYACRRRWHAIGESLQVCTKVGKGMSVSSLRPGGVTAFYALTEDIPRLLRRARWANDSQLTTYVQEVTPHEFLASLTDPCRARLYSLAACLPAVVDKAIELMECGVPSNLWYPTFQHLLHRS